ncbi:hypothetical protein [Vibrio taketomensis]|uniref:hypothetical protein n=1 Tax=Vibrio taketomensis TaxID=2572923 RepID=UPI001389B8F6|nr:hypothetical protein [Vibrio taketomensis]
MNRTITSFFTAFIALVSGFFILVAGLIVAIPLAIVGAITGRKLVKTIEKAQFQQQSPSDTHRTIDGEFEEINK